MSTASPFWEILDRVLPLIAFALGYLLARRG